VKGEQVDLIGMLDGMKAAEDAANHVEPSWSERALEAMLETGRALGKFTIEDVREACKVESPTDQRAWGGVVQRAARLHLITRVGYAPAKSSNGSPKPVWRVA
jgi:hypothetical protein